MSSIHICSSSITQFIHWDYSNLSNFSLNFNDRCDQFDFRTGDQKGEYDQDYDKCCDIRQTITPGIN